MTLRQNPTLEEFLEWPDQKPYRELIGGVVRPKPMPDNLHGYLQFELAGWIKIWNAGRGWGVTEQRCILEAYGETHVVLPDVAWFSKTQLPVLVDGPVRVAPTLAIEIVSKDDRYSEVEDKVMLYLASGVSVVWVFDPRIRNVKVYHPDQAPQPLRAPAVLSDSLLPGLEIPLADLFAPLPEPSQPPVT
jgi:Uma2 family endonuclease